jgi:hypothetical protein
LSLQVLEELLKGPLSVPSGTGLQIDRSDVEIAQSGLRGFQSQGAVEQTVVPATQEAQVRGSHEPRSWRLTRAK